MKFTIKEYIDYLNTTLGEGESPFEYVMVSQVINFFVKCGVIKDTGEVRRVEGARGKGATVFEIPESWEIVFWEKDEKTVDKLEVIG